MTSTANTVTCGKCGGSGNYHFRGGAVGVCFPCEGTGKVSPVATALGRTPRKLTRDHAHGALSGWYRAAKRDHVAEGREQFTMADVLDPECCGWSLAGLNEALDLVPGSRAAFRALGWAV